MLLLSGGPLRSTSGLLGDTAPGKLTPQWLVEVATKNSALVVRIVGLLLVIK